MKLLSSKSNCTRQQARILDDLSTLFHFANAKKHTAAGVDIGCYWRPSL